MPVNPHAGVIDAAHASGAAYQPENALAVLALLAGAAECVSAVADMLSVQGGKVVEEFPIDPAAGEALARMGGQLAQYRSVVEDAAATFESVHHADLERIRNPRPHEAKWDVSANAE